MPSRAALIADLKRQKVRGSLSKMSKKKLLEIQRQQEIAGRDGNSSLEITAGAAVSHPPQGNQQGAGISLAPIIAGAKVATSKEAPKKQSGGGAYRAFVKANIGKHNGDMKQVAAAWREQKGSGHSDSGHKEFMKATHKYCKGPNVEQYMEGGAYWSSNQFRGGSWWHDAWSGVKNVGKAVAKVAPMTAETPLIGPEIAAGAETVGRVAQGVGTVGSLLTNSK